MVVKPSDCTEGNIAFQHAIKQYTDLIDDHLKRNWYTGCPGLQIFITKIDYVPNILIVQKEVIRLYTEAGWDIKFESSDDYRNDSNPWISIKQST